MTLHRTFVSPQFLALAEIGNSIEIPNEVLHRLTKVLRISNGVQVELFDGQGTIVRGHMLLTREFRVESVERMEFKGVKLILVQALVKQDKLEEIVQHSTELGVHEFIIFSAKNSIVKETQRTSSQMDRLQRIAVDASRQCERFDVPKIVGPLTFQALTTLIESSGSIVFFGEPRVNTGLTQKLAKIESEKIKEIMLIVGPEGGLDATEASVLTKIGAHPVKYAPHVLRTQTAGLVGMSIIQSYFT